MTITSGFTCYSSYTGSDTAYIPKGQVSPSGSYNMCDTAATHWGNWLYPSVSGLDNIYLDSSVANPQLLEKFTDGTHFSLTT